jgi:hypothetical protein
MNDRSNPVAGSVAPAPHHPWFEPLALVLLSLATVGTAWCSYQAAVWSGISQRTMNLSAAAGRRSAASQLQAYQFATVDIILFSQYINARSESNVALAEFYSRRFRGEAKTAFDAWMATRPFDDPNAPPHPFVTNLYHPQLLVQAAAAGEESQGFWLQAGEAGRTSRSYVLITVILASALFCGGTAPKFNALWIRRAVLALGLGAFLFGAGRVSLLPVHL